MGDHEDRGNWISGKSWYHPGLNRTAAEELLRVNGKPGSFLVRPSRNSSSGYAISFRYSGENEANNFEIFHVYIAVDESRGSRSYCLAGQSADNHGTTYETVYELLEAHRQKPVRTDRKPAIQLLHVMNCVDPVVERWYHGFLAPQDAEELLDKYNKRYAFLVRESFRQRGVYTISVRTSKHDTPCEVHHVHVIKKGGLFTIDGDKSERYRKPGLVDLVTSLKDTSFRLGDGMTKVAFKYPLNSPLVIAVDVKKVIDRLEKPSKENNQSGFAEEFMKLQATKTSPNLKKNICMLPQNRQQNRYKNILPYDHSLVKLTDGGGKDYINANYIRSEKIDDQIEQTTYIATQGPLAHTMVDFWRMVVQEKSRVIVMTTKIVERGKNKCAKYWPDDVTPTLQFSTECGTIHVTYKDCKDEGVSCLREFTVYRDGQKPVRPFTVFQYHFIAWPDFGVPKNPGLMLQFLRTLKIKYTEIKQEQTKRRQTVGPLIVHCSAGIGRTGTVIVLDTLIQQIVLRNVHCAIDIFETVLRLRQQREGMIQTDPQYKFLYVAIEHYVGTMVQRRSKPSEQNGQAAGSEYENMYSTGGGMMSRK